jgi:FdrA protein
MSATAYSVRRHTYLDSVFLMRVAKALEERPGVTGVAALMATPANKEVLREAGFSGAEVDRAAPDDLVVGVTAPTAEEAQIALSGLLGPDQPTRAHLGSGGGPTATRRSCCHLDPG